MSYVIKVIPDATGDLMQFMLYPLNNPLKIPSFLRIDIKSLMVIKLLPYFFPSNPNCVAVCIRLRTTSNGYEAA